MTRAQALRIAKRALGAKAYVDEDRRTHYNGFPLPASPAERAEYRAKYLALKDAEPKWKPLDEWDGATPLHEYRDALRQHNATKAVWRAQSESTRGLQFFHRYAVGVEGGLFRERKGSGDSWEDALRAAKVEIPEP